VTLRCSAAHPNTAAMASIEGLQISDEKKKYITETLNPLLEEFVTKCLTTMGSPLQMMQAFVADKQGSSGGGLKEENEKLKKEIEQLKAKVEEAGKMVATSTEKQEDKDEDDEDEEEDDELDEIPESFKKPEGQMAKMRTSVSAEAYGAWNQKKDFDPPQYPKTDEQKQRLNATLAKSFLFSSLEGKDMDTVILAMKEKVVGDGERLIQQGEDGDYLFVIEEGTIACLKKMEDGTEKVVKTCEPGDCFGELALLYNCPRAASVDSKSKCVLWQLDRETFNHIVKDAASKKRERYEAFLSTVPLLKQLDTYERSQIADGLCRETYEDGADVVVEEEPGDKFFIIESGEACAEKKGVGKVMDYQVGDYFGELALLRNQPRAATVKAKGALTVLSLPRGSFKRLLGPLDDILSRSAAKYS